MGEARILCEAVKGAALLLHREQRRCFLPTLDQQIVHPTQHGVS